MKHGKRVKLALIAAIALFEIPGLAGAAWVITTAGNGYSKALTMPTASTPTLATSTNNVTVSWTGSTIGGSAVTGYLVNRYDNATSVLQSIGANCAVEIAGTSCTENAVPGGHWKYNVQPKQSNWLGTTSAYSAAVHIAAAPTSITCGNCGGVGSAYINSSMSTNVTVNVALPSTSENTDTVHVTLSDGTNTVTPATKAATTGVGTLSWTGVSTATLNQGTITFTAWVTTSTATTSPNRTNTYTKDTVAPTASDIQTTNVGGGTIGRMDTGDTVVYTFSEAMDPNSLLAGWNGSSTSVTVAESNSGGNDTFSITGVNDGTVNMHANYISGNISFTSSTLVMSGATMTATLGTCSNASKLITNSTAANMTWAPTGSAKDLAGNTVSTASHTESGALDVDF
jgi:hypothetical protein